MRPHFLAIILLAGCQVQPVAKPAAPMGAGEQVTTAQNTATTAQGLLDAAKADRLGRVASDSDAANKALNEGRTADAKGAVSVQQVHLEGVTRSPEESAKLAEAEQHRAEGRADKAEETLGELRQSARGDAVRIADLTRERDAAVKARDKAVDDYKAECATNMLRQQQAIDDALADAKKARDALDNAERSRQVAWCNKIGFGALGVAVALLVGSWLLGGLAAIRKMGPAAGLVAFVGLCALWAARVLGHPWFMPGMTIVIVGVLTWVVVWWRKHDKRGDLNEELANRGAKAVATLNKLVPTIDAVYREGTQTVDEVVDTLKAKGKSTIQDMLDSVLFSKLSAKLDTPEKDTVRAVRDSVDPIQLS